MTASSSKSRDTSGRTTAEEEEEIVVPSSAVRVGNARSPSKEAWGGVTKWRGKDARGRSKWPASSAAHVAGSAASDAAGMGSATTSGAVTDVAGEAIINRLYHFRSKASQACEAQSATQSVGRLGELRHLDQSNALSASTAISSKIRAPIGLATTAMNAGSSAVHQLNTDEAPAPRSPDTPRPEMCVPPGMSLWSRSQSGRLAPTPGIDVFTTSVSAMPPVAVQLPPPPQLHGAMPPMELPPSLTSGERAVEVATVHAASRGVDAPGTGALQTTHAVATEEALAPFPLYDAAIAAAAAAALAASEPFDDQVIAAATNATINQLVDLVEYSSAVSDNLDAEVLQCSPMRSLTMDDFELLRLVGKGGYGKVFQVRCLLNNMVYAMKVVDKASIERYRSMDNIMTELSILRTHAESRHPFILGLECAFQSVSKLHFVMVRMANMISLSLGLFLCSHPCCPTVRSSTFGVLMRAGRHLAWAGVCSRWNAICTPALS